MCRCQPRLVNGFADISAKPFAGRRLCLRYEMQYVTSRTRLKQNNIPRTTMRPLGNLANSRVINRLKKPNIE